MYILHTHCFHSVQQSVKKREIFFEKEFVKSTQVTTQCGKRRNSLPRAHIFRQINLEWKWQDNSVISTLWTSNSVGKKQKFAVHSVEISEISPTAKIFRQIDYSITI